MLKPLAALVLLNVLPCVVEARGLVPKASPPDLKLPWGTYEPAAYGDDDGDSTITIYKNIRFGQSPTDHLRFKGSLSPEPIDDSSVVQNSSYGPSCIQASIPGFPVPEGPEGSEKEDCLFLDVYVPNSAFKNGASKLPVIVYFYGGAYIFGSKDSASAGIPLYDGKGIIDASKGGVIWVVGNYRLGAYGFLAGETMEKEGQPNAGLRDQRLLLEWVQKYIDQVAGDKDDVSVWGMSAGAGSILHHLVARGGKQDPLFKKAVMWSPAYQWAYDQSGSLEQTFKDFADSAGCGDEGLDCLRQAKPEDLKKANQHIVDKGLELGTFPLGPAVDGSYIEQLAPVSFETGDYANISSLIVSHVQDEAGMFTPKWVKTPEHFTSFLAKAFPGDHLQDIRDAIEDMYPAKGAPFHGDQTARLTRVLQDSTFTCNTRQLYDAYRGSVYSMQYFFPTGQHGADLLPMSWNANINVPKYVEVIFPKLASSLRKIISDVVVAFSRTYQLYFVSHAMHGDPNKAKSKRSPKWPISDDDGNMITNSLKATLFANVVNPFFNPAEDKVNTRDACEFWNEIAGRVTEVQRRSAKGGLRKQSPGQTRTGLEL